MEWNITDDGADNDDDDDDLSDEMRSVAQAAGLCLETSSLRFLTASLPRYLGRDGMWDAK